MPERTLVEGEEAYLKSSLTPDLTRGWQGKPQSEIRPSTDLPRPWPFAHPLTNDHTLD